MHFAHKILQANPKKVFGHQASPGGGYTSVTQAAAHAAARVSPDGSRAQHITVKLITNPELDHTPNQFYISRVVALGRKMQVHPAILCGLPYNRSHKKYKMKMETKLIIAGTAMALTAMMLGIDYLGVCVLDMNGLFFNVHIYWSGLSGMVSAVLFGCEVHLIDKRKPNLGSILAVLGLTAAWWIFTLWAGWMFHGFICGWY